jgi:hypothetical protein
VDEDGGEVFLGAEFGMKIAVTVVVLAAIATFFLLTRSRGQASTDGKTEPAKTKSDPKEVYLGLRNSMLQGSRSKFNLAAASSPTEPWGVAMDWGVEKGTVTVVALSDGSASVYFSTGGGYIGGGGQEPIRKAAKKAVDAARSVQASTRAATAFPLPQRGGVIFYLLTDKGAFAANTTEAEVSAGSHPFRELGDAMQGVITQYRLWDEQQGRSQNNSKTP